jgi:hypothetical protein
MAYALKAVVEDCQHQALMAEAEKAGRDLPDMKAFKADLDSYMAFLDQMDPYRIKAEVGDEMRVPYETAAAMQNLILHNCLMLSWVLRGSFETDYLKQFTILKERNTPYAGPTALQQAFNLYGGMAEVGISQKRHKLTPTRKEPPSPAAG